MVELEKRNRLISQIEEIYTFFCSKKDFAKLIPEVRTNISGALSNAQTIEEVAGIEGRITIIDGFPRACGTIKFGASNHTARLVLTAKDYEPSISFVINLKYIPKLIVRLEKESSLTVLELHREKQPKGLKKREDSTMQWLIKESVQKTGNVPDIIWDSGAIGKEPMMRVFAKSSQDLISKLKEIVAFV